MFKMICGLQFDICYPIFKIFVALFTAVGLLGGYMFSNKVICLKEVSKGWCKESSPSQQQIQIMYA